MDASVIGTSFWTKGQDSTGTRALLATTQVSEIRIGLTYVHRDSTVNLAAPVDSLKIRIISTDLEVDQTDGTTWIVSDQQDFFFRKGMKAKGENPGHWFIYEWDELPTLNSPGLPVEPTTWGKIKTLYAR